MNIYEKAEPVVHYRISHSLACGRGTHLPNATDVRLVTCQRCRRTEAFGLANLSFSAYTDAQREREQIKAALDAVFESAHEAAQDAGHCDTYEDILGQITVPDWYTIPPRKVTFEIRLRDYSVEASNEDEAIQWIIDNIGDYIRVDR